MMSVLKNMFVIIGLLLVAGLGYYLYQGNESLVGGHETGGLQVEAESEDFIRRLEMLKRISIDKELFTDPRFTTLRSFATPPPILPTGRSNPFQSVE